MNASSGTISRYGGLRAEGPHPHWIKNHIWSHSLIINLSSGPRQTARQLSAQDTPQVPHHPTAQSAPTQPHVAPTQPHVAPTQPHIACLNSPHHRPNRLIPRQLQHQLLWGPPSPPPDETIPPQPPQQHDPPQTLYPTQHTQPPSSPLSLPQQQPPPILQLNVTEPAERTRQEEAEALDTAALAAQHDAALVMRSGRHRARQPVVAASGTGSRPSPTHPASRLGTPPRLQQLQLADAQSGALEGDGSSNLIAAGQSLPATSSTSRPPKDLAAQKELGVSFAGGREGHGVIGKGQHEDGASSKQEVRRLGEPEGVECDGVEATARWRTEGRGRDAAEGIGNGSGGREGQGPSRGQMSGQRGGSGGQAAASRETLAWVMEKEGVGASTSRSRADSSEDGGDGDAAAAAAAGIGEDSENDGSSGEGAEGRVVLRLRRSAAAGPQAGSRRVRLRLPKRPLPWPVNVLVQVRREQQQEQLGKGEEEGRRQQAEGQVQEEKQALLEVATQGGKDKPTVRSQGPVAGAPTGGEQSSAVWPVGQQVPMPQPVMRTPRTQPQPHHQPLLQTLLQPRRPQSTPPPLVDQQSLQSTAPAPPPQPQQTPLLADLGSLKAAAEEAVTVPWTSRDGGGNSPQHPNQRQGQRQHQHQQPHQQQRRWRPPLPLAVHPDGTLWSPRSRDLEPLAERLMRELGRLRGDGDGSPSGGAVRGALPQALGGLGAEQHWQQRREQLGEQSDDWEVAGSAALTGTETGTPRDAGREKGRSAKEGAGGDVELHHGEDENGGGEGRTGSDCGLAACHVLVAGVQQNYNLLRALAYCQEVLRLAAYNGLTAPWPAVPYNDIVEAGGGAASGGDCQGGAVKEMKGTGAAAAAAVEGSAASKTPRATPSRAVSTSHDCALGPTLAFTACGISLSALRSYFEQTVLYGTGPRPQLGSPRPPANAAAAGPSAPGRDHANRPGAAASADERLGSSDYTTPHDPQPSDGQLVLPITHLRVAVRTRLQEAVQNAMLPRDDGSPRVGGMESRTDDPNDDRTALSTTPPPPFPALRGWPSDTSELIPRGLCSVFLVPPLDFRSVRGVGGGAAPPPPLVVRAQGIAHKLGALAADRLRRSGYCRMQCLGADAASIAVQTLYRLSKQLAVEGLGVLAVPYMTALGPPLQPTPSGATGRSTDRGPARRGPDANEGSLLQPVLLDAAPQVVLHLLTCTWDPEGRPVLPAHILADLASPALPPQSSSASGAAADTHPRIAPSFLSNNILSNGGVQQTQGGSRTAAAFSPVRFTLTPSAQRPSSPSSVPSSGPSSSLGGVVLQLHPDQPGDTLAATTELAAALSAGRGVTVSAGCGVGVLRLPVVLFRAQGQLRGARPPRRCAVLFTVRSSSTQRKFLGAAPTSEEGTTGGVTRPLKQDGMSDRLKGLALLPAEPIVAGAAADTVTDGNSFMVEVFSLPLGMLHPHLSSLLPHTNVATSTPDSADRQPLPDIDLAAWCKAYRGPSPEAAVQVNGQGQQETRSHRADKTSSTHPDAAPDTVWTNGFTSPPYHDSGARPDDPAGLRFAGASADASRGSSSGAEVQAAAAVMTEHLARYGTARVRAGTTRARMTAMLALACVCESLSHSEGITVLARWERSESSSSPAPPLPGGGKDAKAARKGAGALGGMAAASAITPGQREEEAQPLWSAKGSTPPSPRPPPPDRLELLLARFSPQQPQQGTVGVLLRPSDLIHHAPVSAPQWVDGRDARDVW